MSFRSLVEDNSGGVSSIRVLMLAWFLTVASVWTFVAISTRHLPDVPAGVVALSGILAGGKVAQRFGEKDTPGA